MAHVKCFGASAAVLACGLLVLTACTSSPTTTPTTTPTETSASLPFDEAGLQSTFDEVVAEMGVYGAVAIVKTPDGTFVAESGVTERGGSTPVSVDDHIRVGSNTKTWTGTVILQLAQEGKIALDDPVSTYRPDVPNGENITIAQLLEMRSGLANFTATLTHNETMDAEPQKAWTPEELLALAYAEPPAFPPGEGFLYSNTNTVLLGLIAEQLEGKPLEQIFQERLFDPLGLSATSFPAITSNELPEPFSHGYQFGTNVETMDGKELPPDLVAGIADGTAVPIDHTFDNPSWGWAAGAGISTANDLVTWIEAMVGGELLDEEYQELRMQSIEPANPDDPASAGYGLAIAEFGPMFGHTGEVPGYNSFVAHDPAAGVTIVTWANLAPLPDGRAPATTLARALMGKVYPGLG